MEVTPHTVLVHAHKPTIESLLGIKYILKGDFFVITNISDESIFKDHSELRVGHEVVEVNGTPIAGQTKDSVKTLLASLGESVVFAVKSSWTAKIELVVTEEPHVIESHRTSDNGEKKSHAKARLVTNYSRNKIPKFLEGRNVPMGIWRRIYEALDTKLFPALADLYKMDEAWKTEMSHYEKVQGQKQADIFATGVKHHKQIFQMAHSVSILANSASMVANNMIMWLNALLQPYGLLCQLDLEAYQLPKYSDKLAGEPFEVMRIKGVEFTPIDIIVAVDEIEVSVHTDDRSILTGDEEIDTTRWC
ncbi:unnamed protein product [Cylindrotheca closterium]|uniref:PDZ domain-containing protein n=1 Tax=Cylindrotheca closterium TaxID=2856 RepID=A0AAD2PU36_9STRA|nr:unnamed protein product [Cylindrotheca closterium]